MASDSIFGAVIEESVFEADSGRGPDKSTMLDPSDPPGGLSGIQLAAAEGAAPPVASPLQIDAAQVVIPEGESVVRVAVTPDETVELPFGADAQFLVRFGDGNLAIKVGDVTVILEGYAEATNDPQHPVVVEAADGTPLDIATLLAATDPTLDIQTAAGPGGGQGGPGAGNTGAIFQAFGLGDGLGGFGGAGALGDSTGPDGFGPVAQSLVQILDTAVTVTPNVAPETSDTSASGNEDVTSIKALLTGTDSDGTVASFTITSLPTDGKLYADSGLSSLLAVGDSVTAAGNQAFVYFVPDHDFNGTVTMNYAAVDNGGLQDSTPATVTIAVIAVNDAPVNTVPGTQTLAEDTPTVISGISIADVDAGTADVKTTLSVLHGTLAISGAGLTITGSGTGTVTLTGSQADINAALANLTYTPASNYNGSDTLTVKTNDLGNTGLFGAKSDTDTIAIDVTPVNDAPVAIADILLTNNGIGTAFEVPYWAFTQNDIDPDNDSLSVGAIQWAGSEVNLNLGGGQLTITDKNALGATFQYAAHDGTVFSGYGDVAMTSQAGGNITGTSEDEILVGTTGSEKLVGVGGDDIIIGHGGSDEFFGGTGDDTLVFQTSTVIDGGTDTVATSGGLADDAANHGDVLALGTDLKLADSADAANFDGIETISMQESVGGTGAQNLTIGAASIQQISDHSITPGGVFAEHEAIRVDGDAVDQLYLSISKDGGQWVDTGVTEVGYHIYAHETTGGDATTTDAYAMVSTAVPTANVHLNQDAP